MTINRTVTPAPTLSELVAIYEITDAEAQEKALNDYYGRVYWHECSAEEDARRMTEMNAEFEPAQIEVTTAESAQIQPLNKHLYGNMSEKDANKLARFLTSPIKKQPMTHTIMDSHRAARIEREYWRGVNGLHYGTMLNRSTP